MFVPSCAEYIYTSVSMDNGGSNNLEMHTLKAVYKLGLMIDIIHIVEVQLLDNKMPLSFQYHFLYPVIAKTASTLKCFGSFPCIKWRLLLESAT